MVTSSTSVICYSCLVKVKSCPCRWIKASELVCLNGIGPGESMLSYKKTPKEEEMLWTQ